MTSNLNTHIICPECEASFVEPYIGDKLWNQEFTCPICNATLMAFKALGCIQTIKKAPIEHKELEWHETKVPFLKIATGGKGENQNV